MFLKASCLDEHSRIACTNCAECTRIGRSVKRAFAFPCDENTQIFVYKNDSMEIGAVLPGGVGSQNSCKSK
jgi:hypothetical protein